MHRRQHRHERRRQEGRVVGHRARQPGLVEDGRSGRQLAGSRTRSITTTARSTSRKRSNSASSASTPAARSCWARNLVMPGAAFRKIGLGKDVTDKFLGGLPGRAEGRHRRHHRRRALGAAQDAAGGAHRLSRVLRPGARGRAGHRRDHRLLQTRAVPATRPACNSPASSTSTSVT